jgi:hypothetical protein
MTLARRRRNMAVSCALDRCLRLPAFSLDRLPPRTWRRFGYRIGRLGCERSLSW